MLRLRAAVLDRRVSASPTANDALFQALMLGLCTAWCYDPRRPVLWTRASLTRHLELFDGRGFYV